VKERKDDSKKAATIKNTLIYRSFEEVRHIDVLGFENLELP
jgi:hypothetical protein